MLFCSQELHQRILHFSISKVQFYSDLLQSFGKFKEMQKRKRKKENRKPRNTYCEWRVMAALDLALLTENFP